LTKEGPSPTVSPPFAEGRELANFRKMEERKGICRTVDFGKYSIVNLLVRPIMSESDPFYWLRLTMN